MDHGDESTSDGIRFKCTMYEHGLSVDGAFDHGRRGSSWAPFGMLAYTIRCEPSGAARRGPALTDAVP